MPRMQVVELDIEADGDDIQSALASWTGQRTVPAVFVGGNFLGGCDGEWLWPVAHAHRDSVRDRGREVWEGGRERQRGGGSE